MPSEELAIVPLSSIPCPPYSTPSNDPIRMYAVSKRMEALCVRHNGMGLAAAQVGLPWRMFVFRSDLPGDGKFGCYFDCEYEPVSPEKSTSVEGCLSLPGEHYAVDRYPEVRVTGMRLVEGEDGPVSEPFSETYSGIMAVLMQHEIDHERGRERMIDVIGRKVRLA